MKAGTHETEKSCFYYIDFLVLVLFNNKRKEKPLLQDIFHKVRVTNLTQGGLKAMESLEELRKKQGEILSKNSALKGMASNEMCIFLIINISSLQLIPMNVIAYRSQYGSVNPTAVIGPGILATVVSTVAAVMFCKVMDRKRRV